MTVRVKICGITRAEDALRAVEYGADALGFVFYEQSPRHVFPESAARIIEQLPPFITTVGVFVNEHPNVINETISISGIDIVQLHGDEPPELCSQWPRTIKAFRVRELSDLSPITRYRAGAYLLDTYSPESYGGTGKTFNWEIAIEAKRFGPVILAGGLTPENVAEAIKKVRPYGIDVSSGVESQKGIKDPEKMKALISRAKAISLEEYQ
ncbi:MAG: phosphoribosylanthranilate isomerase [Nitrospirae bacterium]|nr:MAG: phosphoribosylanthranilate isomerase [Nitrospirota bacterium]